MGSIEVDISTRDRYAAERTKRLAAAPNYVKRLEVSKDSSVRDLLQDPWVDYDALAKEVPYLKNGSRIKFLIVGAGHSGLIHAYHIVKAGFDPKDLVVVDTAGGWGGTWYWNRYPGLKCDVEGYCYLPLLEESGFIPQDRYSHGDEIRRNAEHIAAKYGLQGMFCTRFVAADWNEPEGRWDIMLRRQLGPAHEEVDFAISTQFLITATGLLSSMSIPSLPGIEDFRREKKLFHAARWDYDYTGGSPTEPHMSNLRDKLVGIVGTAATAVQAVPELAKWAKHLYVFQRTPTYIGPHEDNQTTPELWDKVTKGGKPGWQAERMVNLELCFTDDAEVTPDTNLVQDERSRYPPLAAVWGSRRAVGLGPEKAAEHTEWMLRREAPHAARLRKFIKQEVKDPETAEKLTPWYPGWCKRPAFNNDYLQAFNLPNVTLVDTDGRGVQRYTRNGVVVGEDGAAREYELDALVLATGFEISGTGSCALASSQASCRGRNGRDLNDKWNSPDFATFYGVSTNGFPNMFMSAGANSAGSANMTGVYGSQARMTAHIIAAATARSADPDKTVVEVSKEAELAWLDRLLGNVTWFTPLLTTCPPTYFTGYKTGAQDEKESAMAKRKLLFPLGPVGYDEVGHEYIQKGDLEGVIVH
ncbi:uncharacterized protein PG998_002736 [Apiospora kogelbergensis]|uniref:uncharacterized protein n=1 Tax=Apiospora kogelbergensis TaxID=1337665 RepID=UPI00312F135A